MLRVAESAIYEFGEFRLKAANRRLYRLATGAPVPLQPKAAEVLLFLVSRHGELVTKNEILEAVWEDSFVEEANLSQTVFVLRKALAETSKEPRFILTVPHQGYKFIAPVEELNSEDNILEASILFDSETPDRTLARPPARVSNPLSARRQVPMWWLAVPLALLVIVGAYWFYRPAKPVGLHEIKTLAVLPFEDVSVEPSEKYLGVSLADAVASKFGHLRQITVRPTRSVLKYAGKREDAAKIGRELQVDAVLDGRIQRVGEKIRVNVQLIRTADNAAIWAGEFNDQFTNFFAVQDSISRQIAQSLAVRIDEKERLRFNRKSTENAQAYQEYLLGRFFWNKRTAADLQKAITHFEQAAQKDANFAQAYAGLANCYQLWAEYGATTPHEAFPKAKANANKALEIDDQLAEAHSALAYAQAFYDWDFAGAEQSFKRAIELNPNFASAHQWFGEYLDARGRFDEARVHYQRAIDIDPVSPIVLTALSGHYEFHGDSDKEIEIARKVIEIDPNFGYAYFYLGLGYERKGMNAEAAERLAKTMTLFGEPPECAEEVLTAFKKNGLKGWWQKRLEQIETRPHLKDFQAYSKALVQIRLDDKEGALKSLNQAYERRERWMVLVKYQPHFIPLRQDPRFQDLVRRIGV